MLVLSCKSERKKKISRVWTANHSNPIAKRRETSKKIKNKNHTGKSSPVLHIISSTPARMPLNFPLFHLGNAGDPSCGSMQHRCVFAESRALQAASGFVFLVLSGTLDSARHGGVAARGNGILGDPPPPSSSHPPPIHTLCVLKTPARYKCLLKNGAALVTLPGQIGLGGTES